MKRMSHQERMDRRKKIAARILKGDDLAIIAVDFGVSLSTIGEANREFNKGTTYGGDRRVSRTNSGFLVLKKLLDGKKPEAVANILGVTKQWVSFVKRRSLEAGFTFPEKQ